MTRPDRRHGLGITSGLIAPGVLVALIAVGGCGGKDQGPAPANARERRIAPPPAGAPRVKLKAKHRLGVPLHPAPRTRRVSGRLPDGSVVVVLAERLGGRWLQVRAANGITGWITSRYLARRLPARRRPPAVGPAGQTGICPAPLQGPRPLKAVAVKRYVEAGRGPLAAPRRKLVVASYNVWELYDGRGGDRYYSRHHGAPLTPAAVRQRVNVLAAQLKSSAPHVIAFQEIENAALACQVANRAVPGARWRCAAGTWIRRGRPQNLAIASRVGGSATLLTPGRYAPRGVVEWSLLGGRLRVLTVHLKSSRGARGRRDCRNVVRRQAMVNALVQRLGGPKPRSAALVLGDFNFDPPRAPRDRSDDLLLGAGFTSLRARYYPGGAPATYPQYKSNIDLAFFRVGRGLRATGYRVIKDARTDRFSSDHRPIVVTLAIP